MATIIFYQKPGCATNARQIQAFQSAGHDVVVKDILTEPWQADELRSFFRNMPSAPGSTELRLVSSQAKSTPILSMLQTHSH